jgi:hypothetical protein
LNFDLLERAETTRTGLHMEGSTNTVLLAFELIFAICDGLEGFIGDVLKGFRAADVTCVRVDLEKGFDL